MNETKISLNGTECIVKNKEIAAAIRGAIDYINKNGWVRGKFCELSGEVCAGEDLHRYCYKQMSKSFDFEVIHYAAWLAICNHVDSENVAQWNDSHKQTKEKVIKTLQELANKLDKLDKSDQ